MAFTADGGLRVSFDRGEVGAPAAGTYMVTFSEETITPWLSAFGQRAQRQTVTPSRSLDLGATHTPTPVAQVVIAKAKRNGVVLMHDIHPTSVAAVPRILQTLTARGFHFVTVSHLRATL
ncbi:hypothetical protein ACFYWX_34830 [Streptomyces sp. NPDC002888]|uniref:hypothetical protein n=1 Tax=Streptomyces sp. NPDC002888 TaxID=3364668 RepID=UPI0036A1EC33